jgi:hypothetical protein
VGEQHLVGAGRGVGLVVTQPAQLGRGERRDQHAADRVGGGLRAAELADQVVGLLRRAGVVPQQRVVHRLAGRVERDHAVLLPTDRERGRPGEQPVGRGVEGAQPGARVDRGAVRVGGGLLGHDLAGRRVHEDCLGRLGRGVDAEDEVRSHAPCLIRVLN